MVKHNILVAALALVGLPLGLLACESSPYHLPDPPPDSRSKEDGQGALEERADLDRQARAALIELHELLTAERFEEAEDRLSQQTRDFLAHGNPTGDASDTLSAGRMTLPDGRVLRFGAAELLIAGDIARVANTHEGAEEHETRRRRELFVFDANDEPHRVVMIREGDRWVLHKTSVDPEEDESQP